MQESIIILCLAIAVGYLGSTFYKKIRQKSSGCCGCGGGGCSKKHSSRVNCAPEITPSFSPHKPTATGETVERNT